MKRVLFAAMLFATPAMAQQQTLSPEQTLDALVHQATEREVQATLQVTALQRELAAVTKERDDLKAKDAAPAKAP